MMDEFTKDDIEQMSEKDLEKNLRKASNAYYNKNFTIITDELFDFMKDKLEEINPKNKFLKEIGSKVIGSKIKLPYFMGSLDKITPKKGNLTDWKNKFTGSYIVSDKLDGISCLIYKDDDITNLYSRGDGEYGQDISALKSILVDIDFSDLPSKVAIRGELIINKKDFIKIKNKYGMSNARNAVAGLVNSKDKNKDIKKVTQFVAYSVYEPIMKKSKQMYKLEKWGFKVPFYKSLDDFTIDSLNNLLIKRKKESEFEIDGLVIEDNSKEYIVQNENPEHAFAFKSLSVSDIMKTKVIDVEWNISVDGFLKPRIKIETIHHPSGVDINYATAFNAKYIYDNNINIGTIISIIRSGDVIPYILEVIKPSETPKMPNIPYKWTESGVDIVVTEKLEDIDDVAVKRISYFFSTLGVKNISEGIVRKLVDNKYDTVIKILKAKRTNLEMIDGLGKVLIAKIYKNIDNTIPNASISILMSGSRIFGRGLAGKKLEELVNKYPDIMTRDITLDEVLSVDGFGEKMARKFIENLSDFKKFYKEITSIYKFKKNEDKRMDNKLKDEVIVMTGFRDKELEDKIKSHNGMVSNSISRKTTILICNDINDKSTKMTKAKSLGIKIMDRNTFVKKYL